MAKSLLNLKRECSLCGKRRDAAAAEGKALATITPILWRKPKGVATKTKHKAGKGVVICDDCFALAVLANADDPRGRQLWQLLRERLISTYKFLTQDGQ
jgi:hypothetical protein